MGGVDENYPTGINPLHAYRTLDVGLCMWVCNEIWDEISEDGAPPYTPDVVNEFWVALRDGDAIAGMYRIHQLTSVSFQIHAFMLDRTRKESGRVILAWCLEHIPQMQKMIAEIPVIYPNVYHFTKKNGFKDEGINRHSFTKNGKIHDTHRLGMTRQEIEEWLQH